jgi:hypothetical protein
MSDVPPAIVGPPTGGARSLRRQELSDAGMAIREFAQIGGDRDIAPGLAAEVKPRNKLQRMIVNQTAVAYTLAMRFTGRANSWAQRADQDFRLGNMTQAQVQTIEAARLANAAGRLMASVVEAALALDRLRNGAKQTVTVRHLTVAHGGQAIVAGRVGGGRRRGQAADGGNTQK